MEERRKRIWLVAVNAAALAGALVMNTLANALPLNGKNTGEISDSIPDLFAPAGFTFAIWGVIYTLLVVFTVYQAVMIRKGSDLARVIDKIGPWFFISSIGNALWIVAWHWERQIVSLILIVIMLFALFFLHVRLRRSGIVNRPAFTLAVQVPVSIYFGWITVATIANATTALVVNGWNGFGLSEPFWTAVMIGAAVLINLLVILREGDIWFGLVGFWALFGILMKRTMNTVVREPAVITAASIGLVLLGIAIAVKAAMKAKEKLSVAK